MNFLTENIISSGKTWCYEFYASIMQHNVYGYFVVFSRSLSWSYFGPLLILTPKQETTYCAISAIDDQLKTTDKHQDRFTKFQVYRCITRKNKKIINNLLEIEQNPIETHRRFLQSAWISFKTVAFNYTNLCVNYLELDQSEQFEIPKARVLQILLKAIDYQDALLLSTPSSSSCLNSLLLRMYLLCHTELKKNNKKLVLILP